MRFVAGPPDTHRGPRFRYLLQVPAKFGAGSYEQYVPVFMDSSKCLANFG